MSKMIPIVIAFTPNYIVPASVTVQSILSSSNKETRFLFVCLLNEDLPVWQIDELRFLTGERAKWQFVNLKGYLKDVYVNPRYTEAASYRLLIPKLLPDWDKVLYVDCDMVIRNDMSVLYENIQLGENYLAGVFEATLEHQLPHIKAIGCKSGEYINSGFLVMNLELMRKDRIVDKFMDGLKADYLEFPDQDVLNVVCKGRILGLSPVYNSIRTFFLPQYKNDFLKFYSEEEWNLIQMHGNIHYTGGKPWDIYSVMFQEWWREYERLPQNIKSSMPRNGRLYCLFRICETAFGNYAVKLLRDVYRYLKH